MSDTDQLKEMLRTMLTGDADLDEKVSVLAGSLQQAHASGYLDGYNEAKVFWSRAARRGALEYAYGLLTNYTKSFAAIKLRAQLKESANDQATTPAP